MNLKVGDIVTSSSGGRRTVSWWIDSISICVGKRNYPLENKMRILAPPHKRNQCGSIKDNIKTAADNSRKICHANDLND